MSRCTGRHGKRQTTETKTEAQAPHQILTPALNLEPSALALADTPPGDPPSLAPVSSGYQTPLCASPKFYSADSEGMVKPAQLVPAFRA